MSHAERLGSFTLGFTAAQLSKVTFSLPMLVRILVNQYVGPTQFSIFIFSEKQQTHVKSCVID
jgi:hypothetical protein